MLATEFGMAREVSPVQLANAPSPMVVTVFGIFMEIKPVQFKKANCPMPVNPSGKLT